MRVIERKMVAAIQNGRSMRNGNTEVRCNDGGKWCVLLHGNLIADGDATSFSFTLAGWNTPTTRSRVNALLRAFTPNGGVYCRKFVPHYNDQEIGSNEWVGSIERQ